MVRDNKSSRATFALWALALALAIVYCSVVVSPAGFHFDPLSIDDAWHRFLNTPYLNNGSDQRADWMANLLMLTPLGFLLTGALDIYRPPFLRILQTLVALIACIAFVLCVKFLQLYFPRTVSLNYIMAQCLGAVVGTLAYWLLRPRIFADRRQFDARRTVIRILKLYSAAYFIFALLPFDFTLSAADLNERIPTIIHTFGSLPGAGRSKGIRIALMGANIVAVMPIGLLLSLMAPARSRSWYFAACLMTMSFVTILKIFIISATPSAAATAYATAGMLLGVSAGKVIGSPAIAKFRDGLLRTGPLAIPLYVIAVVYVNGLLTPHWITLQQAMDKFSDTRGLIPFWNWYIVTKVHAAQSFAVHAIMYFPIGVMLSLKRVARPGDSVLAPVLALVFALLMEVGRWLKPDFYPDFYESLTAAAGAWLGLKLMPIIWNFLENRTADRTDARPDGGVHDPASRPGDAVTP